MILLHRAFALAEPAPDSDQETQEEMERLCDISRRLSLDSAMQITEMIVCQQQKFHLLTSFATSVQHADAAATIFAKALERNYSPKDLSNFRRAYLILIKFIRVNALTYAPAARLMAKLGLAPKQAESPISPMIPALALTHSAIHSPQSHNQNERRATSDSISDSGRLPGMSAQNGRSAGENPDPEPNFPNLGNIIYPHEMASLGIDGAL